MKPFLTACWQNLLVATYRVPAELLQNRLPKGLALDDLGGDTFVSLVAFEFSGTRILGVRCPGYGHFPELNLRYYVRAGAERGVIFIREYVSSRLVAYLARRWYNEPYRVAPLSAARSDNGTSISMRFELTLPDRTHSLAIQSAKHSFRPAPGSTEHSLLEQRWGFGLNHRGELIRYEVMHEPWQIFPVTSFHIDLDWAAVYGHEWRWLNDATPLSTIFAAGSAIELYRQTSVQPIEAQAKQV
jgi:uncharacterized protein YqjF (DUF2071 family)